MRGSSEPDRKSIQHFQAPSNYLKTILLFVMAGLVPAIHVFLGLGEARTWMPGTRPGMTSFVGKPNSIRCILSQTLRSGVFAASRRMGEGSRASWFETALTRLLTMRVELIAQSR